MSRCHAKAVLYSTSYWRDILEARVLRRGHQLPGISQTADFTAVAANADIYRDFSISPSSFARHRKRTAILEAASPSW